MLTLGFFSEQEFSKTNESVDREVSGQLRLSKQERTKAEENEKLNRCWQKSEKSVRWP